MSIRKTSIDVIRRVSGKLNLVDHPELSVSKLKEMNLSNLTALQSAMLTLERTLFKN